MGRGGDQLTEAPLSFRRVREDVIEVLRQVGDLSLVCYQPAKLLPDTIDPAAFDESELERLAEMHSGGKEQFFFVTEAQLAKAKRSKDPVTLLSNHRKTRRYQYLHPNIPDIFNSGISYERLRVEGTQFTEFFVEDGAELLEMEIDPSRIVAFDGYDFTFWRPDEDHPANRLFGFEGTYGITGDAFNLSLAKTILEQHPWVRYVELREGNYLSWKPSEVFFEAKFPEDVYEQMWQFAAADKRSRAIHKQPTLGVHSIYDMTIAPVKYKSKDEPIEADWVAQFSPLPFDPFGLREARVDRPDYDEQEERY